jgi:hypothetical protein
MEQTSKLVLTENVIVFEIDLILFLKQWSQLLPV